MKNNDKFFNLRLSQDLYDRLTSEAQKAGYSASTSAFIREILETYGTAKQLLEQKMYNLK